MLKAQNLIATVATETGLDFDDVFLKARRLREADLFVRETRSPKSPRVSARHVANLLVMIMTEAPAAFAEDTIARVERMMAGSDDIAHARQANISSDLLKVFERDHNFVDALEALICCAIVRPDDFSSEMPPSGFSETQVGFNLGSYEASIELDVRSHFLRKEVDVHFNYSDVDDPRTMSASRHYRRVAVMSPPLFQAIGRAFHRGEE